MKKYNDNIPFQIKKKGTSNEELATQLAQNMTKQVEYFNMKENGADSTGIVDCTNVFLDGIESGKPIYFPVGVYSITEDSKLSLYDNILLIGDGEGSIVYMGEISQHANLTAKNLKFARRSSYMAGGLFTFTNDTNNLSGTFIGKVLFDSCSFDYANKVAASDTFAMNLKFINELYVRNCKFIKCGTHNHHTKHVEYQSNYFDMQLLNSVHECIHVDACDDAIISKNVFLNSNTDFVDLYPSSKNVIVDGNIFKNGKSAGMEIKVILRDSDTGDGASNLTGSMYNVKITNNHFIGLTGTMQWLELRCLDERATRVDSDKQYYSKDILVSGNTFDDTVNDTSISNKGTTCFVMFSGIQNLSITKNTFKFSKWCVNGEYAIRCVRNNYNGTSNVKAAYGVDVSNNSLYGTAQYSLLQVNNPIEGLVVSGNNLTSVSDATVVYVQDAYVKNAIFKENQLQTAKTTSFYTFYFNTSDKDKSDNIVISNQEIVYLRTQFGFGAKSITLDNCKINKIWVSQNVGRLKIANSVFDASALFNNSVTIDLLILDKVLFDKSTGNPLQNGQGATNGVITKYYESGCMFDKAVGNTATSAWLSSYPIPTKTNDNTYF